MLTAPPPVPTARSAAEDFGLITVASPEVRGYIPHMIEINAEAPGFSLTDHLGRQVTLEQFRGKKHVMLLFYPLDFTPT